MSAKEIKTLRSEGKLDEAMALALANFTQEPDNIWTKRNLGWVYYDLAKQNCSVELFDEFCKNIKSILELDLPDTEKMIFDSIGWLIVKLGFQLIKNIEENLSKLSLLLEYVKSFHLTKPSKVYSALFNMFHKAFKDTNLYLAFADWWDFNNLLPEDYKLDEYNNEGKSNQSLAEKAYSVYARQLLPKQMPQGEIIFDKQKVEKFLPKLENIENSHPEYQYIAYYHAKLLLALGKKDNVLSALLPFAKKKRNDFWVWDILSEAFPDDYDKVFACFCKGLLCTAQEKMTVNLRSKIIPHFIKRQMLNEAKTEIKKIIDIRTANQWRIPNSILAYQDDSWYEEASENKDNKAVYKKYAPIAEEILFSDVPEETIIVEGINYTKKMLNFIISDKEFGFLKYDKFLKNVKIGDTFKVKFLKKEQNGFHQIASIRKYENTALKNKYFKEFSGTLKIREGNTFGFVDDIFIPAALCSQNKITDGMEIKGMAVKSYNNKKNQWGWKAIEL